MNQNFNPPTPTALQVPSSSGVQNLSITYTPVSYATPQNPNVGNDSGRVYIHR